jgi:hypothetical protein
MTAALFRPQRVYLGWQPVPWAGDPGAPPRRPVPPQPYQLVAGWVAAQRREERRMSRPLKVAAGVSVMLLAITVLLGQAGALNTGLTALAALVFAAGTALSLGAVWRGERDLRGRIGVEERRVTAARAAQERELFASQAEHARLFRAWQACEQAFGRHPQWYPVTLPDRIDRIDVVGGTLAGWSAMLTMVAVPRLAAGGEVTVVDLSEGAAARDLASLATDLGLAPLVWVLPGDLPRFDLGVGLPAADLADVLATSAAADMPEGAGHDPARDHAIVARVLEVLGDGATVAQVAAGLRALGQVGDPREDVRAGLLTGAQVERITGMFGRGAADRVVIERALALEARMRALAALGADPAPLPRSKLRIVATSRDAGRFGGPVLGTYVTVSLTHLLSRARAGRPWRHTLCLAGADRLRPDVLDRLVSACEASRTGLVAAYRSVPPPVRQRLGRGNAALAVMRLGNGEDAKAASEQIGTEHRFVLSQLTDTVGASVTDTAGDSYTSTVGSASSQSSSVSTGTSTGSGRGHGHTRAGLAPFGHHTGSASRETSRSSSTSDSESVTRGINASTSWGLSTSRALGTTESLARTAGRSREFLVEPHELQQLPPSAMIVSYAAPEGRQVVLADANPAILTLPTATLLDPGEAPREPGAGGPVAQPPGHGEPRARPPAPAEPGARPPGHGEPGARPPAPAEPSEPREAGQPPPRVPVSWRAAKGRPAPNLGPPPEPLDWRNRSR